MTIAAAFAALRVLVAFLVARFAAAFFAAAFRAVVFLAAFRTVVFLATAFDVANAPCNGGATPMPAAATGNIKDSWAAELEPVGRPC